VVALNIGTVKSTYPVPLTDGPIVVLHREVRAESGYLAAAVPFNVAAGPPLPASRTRAPQETALEISGPRQKSPTRFWAIARIHRRLQYLGQRVGEPAGGGACSRRRIRAAK